MGKKIFFTIGVAVLVLLWATLPAQNANDKTGKILRFSVDPAEETPGQSAFDIEYEFTPRSGEKAFLTAAPINKAGQRIKARSKPVEIRPGRGKARIQVQYFGPEPQSAGAFIEFSLFNLEDLAKKRMLAIQRFPFEKDWAITAKKDVTTQGPADKEPTGKEPGKEKGNQNKEPLEISRDKANPLFRKAAELGNAYRFNKDNNIEIVPIAVFHPTSRPIDKGRIRVTIDYALWQDQKDQVMMKAVALNNQQEVQEISARPLSIRYGSGSARFLLRIDKDKTAETDQVQFVMYTKKDNKEIFSKAFPLARDWAFEPLLRWPPPFPQLSWIKFERMKKTGENSLDLDIHYNKKNEDENLAIAGRVLKEGRELSEFKFEAPPLNRKSGLATFKITWNGSGDLRSIVTDSIRVRLDREDGKTVSRLILPIKMLWKNPAVYVMGERRVIHGTVDEVNILDQTCFVWNDIDKKKYSVNFVAQSDLASLNPGSRVHIGGKYSGWYPQGSYHFLTDCWHVGEGYTTSGTVTFVDNVRGLVKIKELVGPNKEWRCNFTDPAVSRDIFAYDMVEINGTPKRGEVNTLNECEVRYYYHPQPTPLQPMGERIVTNEAGYDIMAQVRSGLVQKVIDDYFQKNPGQFSWNFQGKTLSVLKPQLKLWSSGRDQACLKLTANYAALKVGMDLEFDFKIENERLIVSLGQIAAVNISDSANNTLYETVPGPVNAVVNAVTDQFKGMKKIEVPISFINDFLSHYKILVPAEPDPVEHTLKITDWDIKVNATESSGGGSIFVGLGFRLPTDPNRIFGKQFSTYDIDFSYGKDFSVALADWLISGLINDYFLPVKTYDIDDIVPDNLISYVWDDIKLAILDRFDSEFHNLTFILNEAWLDLHSIDIPLVPDCGDVFFIPTWHVPTMTSPGTPGSRCNTHGVRLENWKATFALVEKSGVPKLCLTSIISGSVIDRSDLKIDISGYVPDIFFTDPIEIISTQFPIPSLNKTFTISKMNGNDQEIILNADIQ
jgi:hypothetical protein